jgi:hypothetical protein
VYPRTPCVALSALLLATAMGCAAPSTRAPAPPPASDAVTQAEPGAAADAGVPIDIVAPPPAYGNKVVRRRRTR